MATMVREAVGVFASSKALQSAVDDLLINGVDRSFLSLMAAPGPVARSLGYLYPRSEELTDDPRVPRMAFVGCDSRIEGRSAAAAGLAYVGACAAAGAVVASDGALAMALAAACAAGAGGGAVGAAIGKFFDTRHFRHFNDQVAHGGIPLWVRVPTPECALKACEIMLLNGGGQVHLHEIPEPEVSFEGGVSQYLTWIDHPFGHWLRGKAALESRPQA